MGRNARENSSSSLCGGGGGGGSRDNPLLLRQSTLRIGEVHIRYYTRGDSKWFDQQFGNTGPNGPNFTHCPELRETAARALSQRQLGGGIHGILARELSQTL